MHAGGEYQDMSAVKVLVTGDPEGRLGALFKRVAAVHTSNGPFDFLFCVGSFFQPAGAKHSQRKLRFS